MAIEILRPNAAGSQTSILNQYPSEGEHWDKVDEETPDGDTTCVSCPWTGYARDLYGLPNHSEGTGTINSITVYVRCRTQYDPDQASVCASCRTHSTTYDGDEQTAATSYANYSQVWATNPNTGSAWTWDEIDALEIGVRLRKPCATGGSTYCTQVWVEIDYNPAKTSSDSGAGSEGLAARLLTGNEVGTSVEMGGLSKELSATEHSHGSDSLAAKIESPTKGGGMKLWI